MSRHARTARGAVCPGQAHRFVLQALEQIALGCESGGNRFFVGLLGRRLQCIYLVKHENHDCIFSVSEVFQHRLFFLAVAKTQGYLFSAAVLQYCYVKACRSGVKEILGPATAFEALDFAAP